jgi:GT2 family glycosyltransferase
MRKATASIEQARPEISIVVVPRERFSLTRRSLESLYAHTPGAFSLIYVDGGAPSAVRQYLERQSRERSFRLLRTDQYLAPNEARNLALPHIRGEYVVFVDNDLIVSPGWLDNLLRCAGETGAWAVGPLYCIGDPPHQTVHMAGGVAHIEDNGARRRFVEKHRFGGQPIEAVAPLVRREPCELLEFHCLLMRTDALHRLGPFDVELLSLMEHTDVCLTMHRMGGLVYFEPGAVVTYVAPPPLAWTDLPFFMARWSEDWNRATLRRFADKWKLPEDDEELEQTMRWARAHRQMALRQVRVTMTRFLGWRRGMKVWERLISPCEVRMNRRVFQSHGGK